MKAKKTISVQEVKELINKQLAQKGENIASSPKARKALALLLEDILLKTGNYQGFGYVEWRYEGGRKKWEDDGKPEDINKYLGDQTRVRYY